MASPCACFPASGLGVSWSVLVWDGVREREGGASPLRVHDTHGACMTSKRGQTRRIHAFCLLPLRTHSAAAEREREGGVIEGEGRERKERGREKGERENRPITADGSDQALKLMGKRAGAKRNHYND